MTQTTQPRRAAPVPLIALGWSLGLFFAITYTLCLLFDLAFPGQAMTGLWQSLLPWVESISIGGYLLGVVETLIYGWFVALIFGPLFNLFAGRMSA